MKKAMKKLLTMLFLVALVTGVLLPTTYAKAENEAGVEATSGESNSESEEMISNEVTEVTKSGRFLRSAYLNASKGRIYVDLGDLTFQESVVLELYAGDTLLAAASLNTAEHAPGTRGEMTGSVSVDPANWSDTWVCEPWRAYKNVVPTEVRLVVDGEVMATSGIVSTMGGSKTMDAADWAACAGTVSPAGGNVTRTYLDATNGRIVLDLDSICFYESVVLELYTGDTLLASSKLHPYYGPGVYGELTGSILVGRASGENAAWISEEWFADKDVVPTEVRLVVDGTTVDTNDMIYERIPNEDPTVGRMDAADWDTCAGTTGVSKGTLDRAYVDKSYGRVFVDLVNLRYAESVVLKLYSGAELLATASLNVNEYAPGYRKAMTGSVSVEPKNWSDTWICAPWVADKKVVPTEMQLWVDGVLMGTSAITTYAGKVVDAADWAATSGTVSSYVVVNGKKYASLDDAAANATAVNGVVTYEIYGNVTATGTNVKYTPDLAVAGADTVRLVGMSGATVTLNGVYYQKLSASGATLVAEGVTFVDNRRKSGEGSDPDPWEFCYIMLDCAAAEFTGCTFVEGVMVSQDVTFTGCAFTMGSQTYEGDSKEYNTDHYGLWIYNNGDIVVDGCTFSGMTYGAIKSTWNHYGSGADLSIVVKDTSFSAATTSKKAPLNLDGAVSVELSNVTANGFATGNRAEYVECDLEDVTVIVDGKTVWPLPPVAMVGDKAFTSLQEAIDAAGYGDTVKLVADVELTGTVKIAADDSIILDLNGKTISGVDTASGSFSLINVSKGSLTVQGNGKITLSATTDRGWSAYSSVISNNQGTVTIVSGTIEHDGGTAMAYAIDNLTNSGIGAATLYIEGGYIVSPYRAIRQFANCVKENNTLNVSGGRIVSTSGNKGAIWLQSSNVKANKAVLNITGGDVSSVYVYVPENGDATGLSVSVVKEAKEVTTLGLHPSYIFEEAYGLFNLTKDVTYGMVAQVGDTYYATLQEAIDAAGYGETVVLIADIELDGTVKIAADDAIVLDLNGKTISGVDTASGSFGLINVNKGTLTVQGNGKITLSATTNRGWNAYSSVISNNQGTVTIVSGTIEHDGGTDMAYAIDNLTNSGIGAATLYIEGGYIVSPYRAIRQFANCVKETNTLNVSGGRIVSTSGNKGAIWLQSSNVKANKAVLNITGGDVSSVYVYVP
ncbi:MAG: hypothetical protein E7260_07155, partial [Lachnospiraceae bacterium]|nr:hypothetical protein [Lachnospiraceae bacterium]